MKKLYGDALRKDAGLTKMLKSVAKKNVSSTLHVVPELEKVAQDFRKTVDRVYGEAAGAVEDFLAKCSYLFVLIPCLPLLSLPNFPILLSLPSFLARLSKTHLTSTKLTCFFI